MTIQVPTGTIIDESATTQQNDRRALLVYCGTFKSMDGEATITPAHIEVIAKNYNDRLEGLGDLVKMSDYAPVQVDHSTSAKDTVGRVVGRLEIGTHKGVPALYGYLRILGQENFEKVADGRWTHLSIGADLEAGRLDEVTITPFPAATDACLLSRVAFNNGPDEYEIREEKGERKLIKNGVEIDTVPATANSQFQAQFEEARKSAEANTASNFDEALKNAIRLGGNKMDEKDAKLAQPEGIEALKTTLAELEEKHSAETDPEKQAGLLKEIEEVKDKMKALADMPESTTKLSEEKDEKKDDDKKLSEDEEDEDKKKKDDEKVKLSAALTAFTSQSSKVRLALREASIKTRLSRLKAQAKVSPAELRKLDYAKLAASTPETIDAVLKTYEAREPVIHVGQLGTIKGMSASEIAKEVRMSNLENETRTNMSVFKNTAQKVELFDPPMPEKKEVEMIGDAEALWGEIVKAIGEGDEPGAKKLFARATKMQSGECSVDETSMTALMSAFADLEATHDTVVRLTATKKGY